MGEVNTFETERFPLMSLHFFNAKRRGLWRVGTAHTRNAASFETSFEITARTWSHLSKALFAYANCTKPRTRRHRQNAAMVPVCLPLLPPNEFADLCSLALNWSNFGFMPHTKPPPSLKLLLRDVGCCETTRTPLWCVCSSVRANSYEDVLFELLINATLGIRAESQVLGSWSNTS